MGYDFKPTSTSDDSIKAILELLKLVFPKAYKFTYEFIRWQYKDNPNGEVVGYDAYIDDMLVAHYATIPIQMRICGHRRKGLLSLNTATHPGHRGKGLFSILANKTFALAHDLGYEFVIGAANANSTHGFLNNLGFYLISPLDVKIGVGKYRINPDLKCSVEWSEKTYKWRLLNPSSKYYAKGDVLFSNKVLGVKAAVKILSKDEAKYTERRKLCFLHPINLYVGLGRIGGCYFDVPHIIKRSPFNLIFKDLRGDIPKVRKEDISFELFDYDVI